MSAPLVAPPEAQPRATPDRAQSPDVERLSRPFRLGIAGIGIALGLFTRLAEANDVGGLDGRPLVVLAALASALVGIGLLLIAAERDRFGPSVAGISAVTALSWAALNWVSPPFGESVTVWSRPDQAVLSILGLGNGLLLAGIVALAGVRRRPTLTAAATLVAGVLVLAANSIAMRTEWPAIISLGIAFSLVLLAWDRSPRREVRFHIPDDAPRVSRAALSFISVALCGTAIQIWLSRMSLPSSTPAIVLCILLLGAAFASLVRVRREIQQRQTTLSEWTSWWREIRTNDFRSELENFESTPRPAADDIIVPPRPLSFPNLLVEDDPLDELSQFDRELAAVEAIDDARSRAAPSRAGSSALGLVPDGAPADGPQVTLDYDQEPDGAAAVETAAARSRGVFSATLATEGETTDATVMGDLRALATWLDSPEAAARVDPLLVAVEAMTLDEYDTLPDEHAATATDEIGAFLMDAMPDADLVCWIDGPYFIIAFASLPNSELMALNKAVRKRLKATAGTLALLRPAADATLDQLVDAAVHGLLTARRLEDRAAGR